MTGPDSDRAVYVGRAAVVSIVLAGLVEHDGPDAVTSRTMSLPGSGESWFAEWVPVDHLAAVTAAGQVADIARGLVRKWATTARGAGCSWTQVAAAMSILDADDPGRRSLCEAHRRHLRIVVGAGVTAVDVLRVRAVGPRQRSVECQPGRQRNRTCLGLSPSCR